MAQYSITVSLNHLNALKIFLTSYLMINMNEVNAITKVNKIKNKAYSASDRVS